MKYQLSHVDTCLPSFFAGSSDVVLCVPVDGDTTDPQVREALLAEIQATDRGDDFDYAAAEEAVEAYFSGARDKELFDESLEIDPDGEGEGESVYAYFTLEAGETEEVS